MRGSENYPVVPMCCTLGPKDESANPKESPTRKYGILEPDPAV